LDDLLLPTAVNFLAGGTLFLLFRAHPVWRLRRPLRAAALSSIFISLTIYAAFAIDGTASVAATAACVLIVIGGYLPVVAHLLTHEIAAPPPEVDPALSLTWRVRRRLLFGGENRRRRLWTRKRRQLPQKSTDALLRLELLELSLGLGEFGEALFHAHALDEILPTGETHAFALHRQAHIIAERQQRLAEAQPTLHRLLRLYPTSEHRQDAERLIRLYETAK